MSGLEKRPDESFTAFAVRQVQEEAVAPYRAENEALREVVEWINGGFVAGERRRTYADPTDFLDEIRKRTDAVLDSLASRANGEGSA
jgi:hypothetical protein